MKNLLIVVAALAMLIFSAPAWAQGAPDVPNPPEGKGISLTVIDTDGSSKTITKVTRGGITRTTSEPVDGTGDEGADSGQCSSGDFALSTPTRRWYTPQVFAIRFDTVPGYLGATAVREDFEEASLNWENANNTCGRGDNISYDGTVQGNTGDTNTTTSGCQSYSSLDGKNVVAFKNLSVNSLAFACVWFIETPAPSGSNTEYMIEETASVYNTDHTWSTSSNCQGSKYVLEGVGTHEFGHMIGLGHVSEGNNLTMTPFIGFCSYREQTLGLGDMLGAETLY